MCECVEMENMGFLKYEFRRDGCVETENMGFSKDEFRRDGWHFRVNCRLVCSYLCG